MQKKKAHDQHPQGEAQAAIDTQKRRVEVLREQAKVIYNIIQGIEDDEFDPDKQNAE